MSQQPTIKIRIDVDYPYPSSRLKSFLYIALGIKRKGSSSYLKNARAIAEIINASPKKVMAYWFFTPYTIPDKKLLDLLNPERHEVGLHVATNAAKELKTLEKKTGRRVRYYTSHGTKSLVAQILWRRKIGQKEAIVPAGFIEAFFDASDPVKSNSTGLDRRMYESGLESVKKEAQKWINEGTVISIHPEWLYVRGEKNRRGPFHEALKIILGVP